MARTTWPGTCLAAIVLAAPPVSAQRDAGRASIVIVTGSEAAVPIPTLMEGPQASTGNIDIADQLFLRLAELGPTLMTAGDRAFLPLLARSWTRRDSVTLAFHLDPRARWHDGVPVTAADVVFTFERARNPAPRPRLAELLRHITSVTAEGRTAWSSASPMPYAEQLYDAVFHVAPLPAHLLGRSRPTRSPSAPFVQAAGREWALPLGATRARTVRRARGRTRGFFLGAPGDPSGSSSGWPRTPRRG